MARTAHRDITAAEVKLVLTMATMSAAGVRARSRDWATPALFTRIRVAARAAWLAHMSSTRSGSAKSHATPEWGAWGTDGSDATAVRNRSLFRATRVTRAPAWANARATANPMPREPPVTTAWREASELISMS